MRESIARHLAEAFAEHKWTVRQACKETGIDISTLSRARRALGSTGVGLLLKLRELRQLPIDVILNLPPLNAKPTPIPAEPAEPLPSFPARERGATLARKSGVPDYVLNAVASKYSKPHFGHRTARWWTTKFLDAYVSDLKATVAVVTSSKPAEPQAAELPPAPERAPRSKRKAG